MCFGCYEEYGSPRIDTPAVRKAAELLKQCEEHWLLHNIVEDFNIDDSDIAFYRTPEMQDEFKPQLRPIANACLDALYRLSVEERASAMAIMEGWFDPENPTTMPADESGPQATNPWWVSVQ